MFLLTMILRWLKMKVRLYKWQRQWERKQSDKDDPYEFIDLPNGKILVIPNSNNRKGDR